MLLKLPDSYSCFLKAEGNPIHLVSKFSRELYLWLQDSLIPGDLLLLGRFKEIAVAFVVIELLENLSM